MRKSFRLGTALLGVAVWLTATPLFSQDIFQQTSTPFVQFGGPGQQPVPWGSGAGAFNNNFFFNMLFPEQGVCVWVTNLNPTNSHSFSLVVSSTGNPNVSGFTGFTGQWTTTTDALASTFPFTLAAASTKTFFFAARSSAFVNLGFSGSATAAGSPDAAIITAVETNAASCSAVILGQTVIGPTPQGQAIAASNQNPLIVGGQQAVGGSGFLNIAQFAAVDSTTHGWILGVTTDFNENITTWRGESLSYGPNIVSGAGSLLHVQSWGQQTDTPLSAGAGDTMSPARCSRSYGCVGESIWSWASTTGTGGVSFPAQTYNTRNDAVNPAAGALVQLIDITNVSNNGLTLYRVTVGCSAACDFFVQRTTDHGTTCGAGNAINRTYDPNINPGAINVESLIGGCVANPTATMVYFHIFLTAGQTWQQNLIGYYWKAGTPVGSGFDVVMGGALTGTITATVEFMYRGGSGI